MDDARIEQVRDWPDRDIDGPADLPPEFTGAIEAGGEWVLVLDGQSVAGNPDRITSGGTAYTAPHDSLPLLFAMEAVGGETRGSYYTEEVGIRETHETLTEAGFTGYIELAENVVSGDYYVVYHGGESRSVAFLGDSGRLLTDEEAFDTAADEVGIYTVESATIEPTPLPTSDASAASATGEDRDQPQTNADEDTAAAAATATGAAAAASDAAAADPDPEPDAEQPAEDADAGPAPGTDTASSAAEADGDPAGHDPTGSSAASESSAGGTGPGRDMDGPPAGTPTDDDSGGSADAGRTSTEPSTDGSAAADASGPGHRGSAPPKPGAGAGTEPAALSETGDVAAVEQTVDQIADRVDRIDDRLDEVTDTLEQLAGDTRTRDEFAVPTDGESESADSADDAAGSGTGSRAPYLLLVIILLIAGVGALDLANIVTVPGMDGVREAIRSLAGLTSELGARR